MHCPPTLAARFFGWLLPACASTSAGVLLLALLVRGPGPEVLWFLWPVVLYAVGMPLLAWFAVFHIDSMVILLN